MHRLCAILCLTCAACREAMNGPGMAREEICDFHNQTSERIWPEPK